jgi:hypothetical protein
MPQMSSDSEEIQGEPYKVFGLGMMDEKRLPGSAAHCDKFPLGHG